MTAEKTLKGKLNAGNPQVWFDEGYVASAATTRCGVLLYRKLAQMLCTVLSSAACVATAAEKLVSQETMKAIYEEVKTPHKVGMVLLPEKGEKIDNPCVFRHGDGWYMIFVVFDGKGYETHLAKFAISGDPMIRRIGDVWESHN